MVIQAPTRQPTTPQALEQPQYEITEADKKRQQRIAAAWKAYDGDMEKPLDKMPGEADDNVIYNGIAPVVHTIDDFLFGKELEIGVENNAPDEVQTFLDLIWGRKEKRLPLLQDLGMNGSVTGRGFLRIVPSREVPGKPKKYRLIVPDPSTIFVKTAPQDCETVLLYCTEYAEDEKVNGRPQRVYYREEIQRIDPDGNASRWMPDDDDTWQIQHWTQVTAGNMAPRQGYWTPAGPPIPWPYPFAPLFSCKNLPRPNEFWATPDVTTDLIGLNAALNLVLSCINRNGKLFGHPLLYGTAAIESIIDRAPGKITWLAPDGKIVAVPFPTDLANMLKFAQDLRSSMDERSSVPGVATGRIATMPRGNLSGIAIELLFMSLLKVIDKKRCLYGGLIIDVSLALLVLNNMAPDIDITLAWQNPLPHDDLPDAQKAVVLKGIGISDTTLQREMGYDPEEELKLSQTENAQKAADFAAQQLPVASPPGQAQPGQQPQASPFIGRQQ